MCTNWNGLIRTAWTRLLIQLVGVIFCFVLSFWASTKIAPFLKIENAFIVVFLLILLLLSNIWGLLNERINFSINNIFPSLKIYRPDQDRYRWLLQALIGSFVFAFTIWLLNFSLSYLGEFLGEFIKK